MTPCAGLVGLVVALAPLPFDDVPPPAPPPAAFAALGDEAVRDLIILGETRPIILRMRVMIGDRSLRAAWDEGAQALYAQLDKNGDGKLTVEEADKNGLALLLAPGAAAGSNRTAVSLDTTPKDGALSLEELKEGLRTAAGPFRLQVEGTAERRTDALFDQLDRDKDGQLTRSEMEAIIGSLHRLDRDANELIDTDEVNIVAVPAASAMMMMGRPVRDTGVPPVLELAPDESPVRLARVLIKQYDTGSSRGPGKRDSKLSAEEFAIPEEAFAATDKNHDGLLTAEELRKYLTDGPRDAVLDVALSGDASGKAVAVVRSLDGGAPAGISVRQISAGVVELDIGLIRLDVHVDDGAQAAETARKSIRTLFDGLDANQDGYLEESENMLDNGQPSPLSAALFKAMDRDGDGKLYPREIDEYVGKQAIAARGRIVLAAANEGRALFGILDMDRDRRLGAREVLETFGRVSACDRDKDGRVSPEEIPHHIQLSLTRGDLSMLLAQPANNPNVVVARATAISRPTRVPTGPEWFRKMDRNRDGDVSPREFLGSREQFDRLDLDHDGLLAPNEAESATAAKAKPVKGPGD